MSRLDSNCAGTTHHSGRRWSVCSGVAIAGLVTTIAIDERRTVMSHSWQLRPIG